MSTAPAVMGAAEVVHTAAFFTPVVVVAIAPFGCPAPAPSPAVPPPLFISHCALLI